ncbi:hypothetical protein ABQE48_14745 [Mycolicibacterium thermoresistibile]
MRTYSGAFSSVLEQVRAQLERSRGERSQLFNGAAIWSGDGAAAANNLFKGRITDLETRSAELKACIELFTNAYDAVVGAKEKNF